MDATSILTGAGKGAAAGMSLGPIGMAAGAVLGAAPGLLDMLGIHLFGSNGEAVAAAALDVVRTVTGKPDPAGADLAGLPPEQMAAVRVQLAGIAAAQEDARAKAALAEQAAVYSDIAGARARDVAMLKTGKRNVRADIMLAVVGIGLITCIVASALGRLDPVAIGIISTVAGTLAGCLKDAFGFEFGSSRSSEAKTAMLAQMLPGPAK